jgi:predicted RNA-binding protein YlxR (DUF448 family)
MSPTRANPSTSGDVSDEGPVRSCVTCRERGDPDTMVRLVLDPDGRAVVDFRGKLPGRGAWVHPGCLAALEARPGPLARAFKRPVPADPWSSRYREALDRALLDGLSMASASGALVGGQDVLVAALTAGQVVEVLLASDCAPRTERHLRAAAREGLPFTRLTILAADLGLQVGRGPRAAVGVRSSRAAAHLLRQLHRLRSLG